MRAMVFDEFGGNENLHMADVPTPDPQKGEVQIKVAYAGCNPVDWKICAGWLKKRLKTEFPAIPGFDVSGTVSRVGEGVTKFQEGDRVYAYCRNPALVKMGTYAEYVCFDANDVAPMPQSLGFKEAAAIPLCALTAWQSFFDKAKLKAGQTVLIHAGAGGVGSLAIQLAKWAGAKVHTTASSRNHDYVKQLGADEAIDYHTENVAEVVPEGFDMVLDCVGEKVFDESLTYVKKGGWLVTICKLFIEDSVGEKYGIRTGFVFVQPNGQELEEISRLFDEGILASPQVTEFPLEEAVKAWEQLQTEHTRGKLVLRL